MRKFNPFFLSVFLLLINSSFAQEFKPDSLRIKGDVERLAATEMGGRGIDDSSYFWRLNSSLNVCLIWVLKH